MLLQMGANKVRQVVVKRDDDVLTPEQLKQHWPEVRQAMLKELQTWCKLKSFSRRPRRGARNVIDVRWVIKFKWEFPLWTSVEVEVRRPKPHNLCVLYTHA